MKSIDPPKDEFIPLGIIECPTCSLSSLSWNMTCARCGGDLMPEPESPKPKEHAHAVA